MSNIFNNRLGEDFKEKKTSYEYNYQGYLSTHFSVCQTIADLGDKYSLPEVEWKILATQECATKMGNSVTPSNGG